MQMVFRVLSVLVALMFLGTGVHWIVDPAAAAEGLGMDLLTGIGASTQIGDISAFFLAASAMIALAQRPGRAHWFLPPAMLVGTAAVTRTLAWMTGNAALATEFIVPEILMTGILLMAARTRSEEGDVAEAAAG